MAKDKQPAQYGSTGARNNSFITEREVDGERRSIRIYHDGRVSQREGQDGPVRTPASSTGAGPSTETVRKTTTAPKFEDLKCDPETAAEIVQYCGELEEILSQLPAEYHEKDTNTPSKQWKQMGGKDHARDSDIHH
ncbi:hypothetical protein N7517_001019 [Penicillium concentricum]|uniref:Uncharacterized protein n=1 Tax=Penicillium concentricum TaxID=293559 RepID=A0A9W9VI49_9EURO|nr:uncharacterized protein N7517_001019 [Penicillium concentricum]KAJ5383108.1 hypothetical protein N7517_001019 [Penicillium concentricum]